MGGSDQPEADDRHIERSLSAPHACVILFERHARPVHRYLVKRQATVQSVANTLTASGLFTSVSVKL
jgi:hypothetical protein